MINIGVLGLNETNIDLKEALINTKCNELFLFGIDSNSVLLEYFPDCTLLNDFQALLDCTELLFFYNFDSSQLEFVHEAIRQGNHVHINNVQTLSLEDISELNNISKEANVKVSLDFPQLYQPIIQHVTKVKRDYQAIHIKDANTHLHEDIRILNAIRTLMFVVRKEIKTIHTYRFSALGDSKSYINIRLEFSNGSIASIDLQNYSPYRFEKYEFITDGEILNFELNHESNVITMNELRIDNNYSNVLKLDTMTTHQAQWSSLLYHINQNTNSENCISELYHTYDTYHKIIKKLGAIQ